MTRRTQEDVVLDYMRDAGPAGITQLQATRIGAGTRLAAIILKLRQQGYNITTETFAVENVLGGISHPGRYVLGTPERVRVKPEPMAQLTITGEEEALVAE